VVNGDIVTARIAIVEGAKVTGEVKMDPARSAGAAGGVSR
jgi:hypothetical protein